MQLESTHLQEERGSDGICFVVMGPKGPTLVFEVEVHVTRARSLPKIKARFHILMLVSWLCDQNDQLCFLGSKFT